MQRAREFLRDIFPFAENAKGALVARGLFVIARLAPASRGNLMYSPTLDCRVGLRPPRNDMTDVPRRSAPRNDTGVRQ